MKRTELDDRLYDNMIDDTSDDPMNLVPPELLHLIPGFLERREKEVPELTALLAKGDFDSIKTMGHKLKGTGLGFGFPLVSEIGRELEAAAAAKDGHRIAESVKMLSSFAAGLSALLNLRNGN